MAAEMTTALRKPKLLTVTCPLVPVAEDLCSQQRCEPRLFKVAVAGERVRQSLVDHRAKTRCFACAALSVAAVGG